jgi:BirA family biotin operon repressor/biotin-[acetyl-CoA-carboxylase] ligase
MYAQMTPMSELPPLNATRFSSIQVVEQTGSTNADLLAAAAEGEPDGAVLVTGHQTAGRGRQNREWHDEPGNSLLVSLLARPALAVAPLFPLLAGVAIVEAINTMDPAGSVGLKWPNDLLAPSLGERKVAGILSESATGARTGVSTGGDATDGEGRSGTIVVVVGMGLNLRWGSPPPDEIASKAASLAEVLGRPVERDDVLHRYLRAFEFWLRRLETSGPEVLLDRYRVHCLTIGRSVRFETSVGERHGVVNNISPTGTLLLQTAAGEVELHAGDAHHIPTETPT